MMTYASGEAWLLALSRSYEAFSQNMLDIGLAADRPLVILLLSIWFLRCQVLEVVVLWHSLLRVD